MPLEKAAAGTPGFGRNIATEEKAGKPPKQAEAIAYNVARGDATPEFNRGDKVIHPHSGKVVEITGKTVEQRPRGKGAFTTYRVTGGAQFSPYELSSAKADALFGRADASISSLSGAELSRLSTEAAKEVQRLTAKLRASKSLSEDRRLMAELKEARADFKRYSDELVGSVRGDASPDIRKLKLDLKNVEMDLANPGKNPDPDVIKLWERRKARLNKQIEEAEGVRGDASGTKYAVTRSTDGYTLSTWDTKAEAERAAEKRSGFYKGTEVKLVVKPYAEGMRKDSNPAPTMGDILCAADALFGRADAVQTGKWDGVDCAEADADRPTAHYKHKGIHIDTSYVPGSKGTKVDYYVVQGSSGRFYSLEVAKEIAEGIAERKGRKDSAEADADEPKYNPESVNKAIKNNRTGKIGGRESKMIHALLRGNEGYASRKQDSDLTATARQEQDEWVINITDGKDKETYRLSTDEYKSRMQAVEEAKKNFAAR